MKIKRDKEIQERMMSGKRKKYTPEERAANVIEENKKRNQHQANNLGRFTKIFILNEDQLNQHKKYYDFAMELYNTSPKQENGSIIISKPPLRDFVPYNHYFEPKTG